MRNLGFKIVRTPYPASSKMTGVVVQKVRDDGRIGHVVGDEALLWDALEEKSAKLAQVLEALKQETQARLDAEKERDELRSQLEQKGRSRR
jgi:hypothetical protein